MVANFTYLLSIKVPIRKKSGNLSNDPRISKIYIYLSYLILSYIFILLVQWEKTVNIYIRPLSSQIRWIRHAGYCRGSMDKVISDFLLWNPTQRHTSVRWSAKTYIHQLKEDNGCSLVDLPKAIGDRYRWCVCVCVWERERERERERWICDISTTWRYIYIYI